MLALLRHHTGSIRRALTVSPHASGLLALWRRWTYRHGRSSEGLLDGGEKVAQSPPETKISHRYVPASRVRFVLATEHLPHLSGGARPGQCARPGRRIFPPRWPLLSTSKTPGLRPAPSSRRRSAARRFLPLIRTIMMSRSLALKHRTGGPHCGKHRRSRWLRRVILKGFRASVRGHMNIPLQFRCTRALAAVTVGSPNDQLGALDSQPIVLRYMFGSLSGSECLR